MSRPIFTRALQAFQAPSPEWCLVLRSAGLRKDFHCCEFLAQLNESWRDRTLIIGATNLIEHIDPAVLRPGRFDRKIFIGPPDLEARTEMLRIHMTDRPQDKIDWIALAGRGVASHLTFLFRSDSHLDDSSGHLDRRPPSHPPSQTVAGSHAGRNDPRGTSERPRFAGSPVTLTSSKAAMTARSERFWDREP